MLRPKNWDKIKPKFLDKDEDRKDIFDSGVEAGADAMYQPAYDKGRKDEREALKQNGDRLEGQKRRGYIWDKAMYGWLVFIPEK